MAPRLTNRQIQQTIFSFTLAVACIAVASGLLLAASTDVAQWVVKGIAWLKGMSLDAEIYGIPRSTLWEHQLRQFGSALAPWSALVGLGVVILRRLKDPQTGVLHGVVFFAGFVLALCLRNAITLPFSNPLGIVGPLALVQQHPGNNTLQYLLVLIIPAAAVLLFDLFWRKGRAQTATVHGQAFAIPPVPRLLATFCAIGLVVLVGGERYTWHEQVPLDSFHEGESLGPAVHWEYGQAPYRDCVIVHGPFQDPLRTVLAFSIFGRSIAASRTMESLLEIAAMCLCALLVFHVFEWDPGPGALATAGLFFFIGNKPFAVGSTIPHRDIMLYLFLLSAVSLYRSLRGGRAGHQKFRTRVLFFICSAIPVASFAYSVDRGLYLSTAALLAIPFLYWTFVRRLDASYLAAIAVGAAVGVFCLGLSIRWAFSEFLTHVFVMLPQVHGLGFSLPYPFESASGRVPLLLLAFNGSWLTHRLVTQCIHVQSIRMGMRQFAERTFVELLLLLLAVLFYLSALGRAELAHIYYSTALIFLLASVIVIRHIGKETLAQLSASHGLRTGFGIVLVVAAVILYTIPGIHASRWFRFPLGAPDDEAIQPDYQRAIAFLRDSVSSRSQFLTLTSEGVWEYFIGRPSPTRFSIVVYALPIPFQEELIRDMDTRQVDYLLYENKHSARAIDDIPFEKRLPRVAQYVRKNYESFRVFDDQVLWRRRGG